MKPLVRLLDDDAVSAGLRSDVARALAEPEPYDVEKGEARLVAALGLGAAAAGDGAALEGASQAAGGAEAASGGLLGSAAVKIGAAATVAVIAVAAWVLPERTTPADRSATPPAPPAAPAAPEPAPVLPEVTSVPRTADANVVDARAGAPAAKVEPGTRGARLRGAAVDDALRREIEQLAAIRTLLESDPARAYRLAQAGHREFARGLLREEREALAVLALFRIGREDEAERRGRAFLERYPQSAHRAPIERHLAAPGSDESP